MKVGPEEAGEDSQEQESPAPSRGMSFVDFVLRIFAIFSTLGSAIAVGKTSDTLPSFRQLIGLKTGYTDLPTFRFFVVANAIVCAYIVLSLLLSIIHIVKPGARLTRSILLILDAVMLAFLMSGASAAAAIVHLAHKGNDWANWSPICQQYNSFCDRVSGALVGSFIGVLALLLLVILSALALSRK